MVKSLERTLISRQAANIGLESANSKDEFVRNGRDVVLLAVNARGGDRRTSRSVMRRRASQNDAGSFDLLAVDVEVRDGPNLLLAERTDQQAALLEHGGNFVAGAELRVDVEVDDVRLDAVAGRRRCRRRRE